MAVTYAYTPESTSITYFGYKIYKLKKYFANGGDAYLYLPYAEVSDTWADDDTVSFIGNLADPPLNAFKQILSCCDYHYYITQESTTLISARQTGKSFSDDNVKLDKVDQSTPVYGAGNVIKYYSLSSDGSEETQFAYSGYIPNSATPGMYSPYTYAYLPIFRTLLIKDSNDNLRWWHVTNSNVIYWNATSNSDAEYLDCSSDSEQFSVLSEAAISRIQSSGTLKIDTTLTSSTSGWTGFLRMYDIADIYDSDNPYPGGDEQTDPGDGSFDYTGDTIDIPDLPSVSVTDSGFVTLYAPTASQLNSLASFMWSDTFSLDSFKKLFNNPMDCILGLSIVPVNVPTSGAQEITIGNIVSTVSCNKVSQQFITVDCGTLTVSPTKFTGSYLDYSPYTKCYIYLPFIGIQQLNIDDVMHSTVHVVYHVDILTGACVCYLKMQNRTSGGQSASDAVLYTFMGQCAESVPLSSTDFSNTLGSILSTAGAAAGVVATVASGGASAPLLGSALSGLASSAANTALSMKPNIQRSGSMGGASGFMNIKYPYMIFDCPHTAIPGKQRVYTGYPSNKILKLSKLSGFNVIQAINLSVDGANDSELAEIKQILLDGVII